MAVKIRPMVLLIIVFFFIIVILAGCHKAEDEEEQEITITQNDLQIYCFSAGKADAFLLTTPNGTVLIDTGEESFGSELVAYLADEGIDHIDYLIVTHFDKDHVGGAGRVIHSVPVSTVFQSNYTKDSSVYKTYSRILEKAQIETITVREPYAFQLDGISYVIDPPKQDSYENAPSNNSSLIVSVTNGNHTFLFTGDAENDRIREFLSDHSETYDFLKVPYHGHWQQQLEDLIHTVQPAYAVITSSAKDREDMQTLELLWEMGAEPFLTRTAAVVVQSDGEEISVQYAE